MKDESKTKEQLIDELNELRSHINEFKNEDRKLWNTEITKEVILNSVSELVVFQDMQSRVLWANRAAGESTGSSSEKLIGRFCYEIWHKSNEPCRDCPVIKARETGQPHAEEITSPDGKYWLIKGYPYRDRVGNIAGVVEITTDITKHKLTEKTIRESEEKFRNLAENSPNIIFINKQGKIAYVNKMCEEVMGYRKEEFYSPDFNFLMLVDNKYLDLIKANFKKHLEGQDVPPYEYVIVTKQGKTIDAIITTKLINYEGDNSILGIVTDVSEYKRIERDLQESEEKYRDLYDNAPDIYYTIDKIGIIIECNETMAKLLGYKKEDIIGRHLTDFFTEESKRLFKRDFPRLNKEKARISLEREFVSKDGSVIPVNLNVFSRFDEDENLIQTRTIARDITDYRHAVEKLRKSEEKHRILVQNVDEIIYIVDTADDPLKGHVSFVSNQVENIIGHTPDEFLNNNQLWFELVHPDDIQSVVEDTRRILESKEKGTRSYRIRHKHTGQYRWFEDKVVPRTDNSGKVTGLYGVARDITERKLMEEEILRIQKLESVSVLAGGIAHDFNNILTAILGNINLATLYAKPGDDIFQRLIEAEKASLRAKELTHQLLTFSKGGAPVKKRMSIVELIKDSAGFALKGSNVKCIFSLPEDIWLVEADEGQMSQVISNLIINAGQSMPEGGLINVSAENLVLKSENELSLKAGNYVRITIEDQGTGIPKESLQKIFDPYFTTKQKGSGLGLAVTHSIIKKHDGHITVESELGSGSAFHIYLSASENQIPVKNAQEEMHIAGKGKVLLMDDDEMVRNVAGDMLNLIGYDVEYAKNADEAIELYKKAKDLGHPFDAVILDLTIPGGMGGKTVIKKLLEIDPAVKAIVSSGYSNDPVMADFRKYGFIDIVAKPYKITELSRTLHRVISQK